MRNNCVFKTRELVWVPRQAIAIFSRPGQKLTRDLWDVGLLIDADRNGNAKVLVDGRIEYIHVNFIKLVEPRV